MTEQCNNVSRSFRDKWERNPDLVFSETLNPQSEIFEWIVSRNGFRNGEELSDYLSRKGRILDAGCGNGRVTALLRTYAPAESEVVGIDLVSAAVARKNLSAMRNVTVVEKDLLSDLRDLGSFDFIYCQEVLHHTSDPKRAFSNLCQLLRPDGEIAIYVYKEKGPIREFADDYIRGKVMDLSYEETIKICNQITEFGRILAKQNVSIHVPALPILGIEEGVYDLQRFIYHFFLKCYWNEQLPFEANSVINYDWYHPQLASRHTIEEVRGWMADEDLTIEHELVDFYGITIRGRR